MKNKYFYRRFSRREKGVSMTGYGLLVGLIAIVALLSMQNIGDNIQKLFGFIAYDMEVASGGNAVPSAIIISPANASLRERIDTSSGIIVASFSVIDDGQGTNNLTISGADAAKFSMAGGNIIFTDGSPDFDSPTDDNNDNIYEISLAVDDIVNGESPDAVADFTLTIFDDGEINLTASDGAADDEFGYATSLSGEMALIGARVANASGADSGAAYLFNCTGGTSCSQSDKLVASDGAAGDEFGYAISLSGNMAVIGARLDDDNGVDSGSAYLFDCSGGLCSEQEKLMASDGAAGDQYGSTVSISGDNVLIGASYDNDGSSLSGSAWLYDCSGVSL